MPKSVTDQTSAGLALICQLKQQQITDEWWQCGLGIFHLVPNRTMSQNCVIRVSCPITQLRILYVAISDCHRNHWSNDDSSDKLPNNTTNRIHLNNLHFSTPADVQKFTLLCSQTIGTNFSITLLHFGTSWQTEEQSLGNTLCTAETCLKHLPTKTSNLLRERNTIQCRPRPALANTVAGLPRTGACSADRTLLAGDAATSSNSSTDVDGFRSGTTISSVVYNGDKCTNDSDKGNYKIIIDMINHLHSCSAIYQWSQSRQIVYNDLSFNSDHSSFITLSPLYWSSTVTLAWLTFKV